jgi:hypothetical protein
LDFWFENKPSGNPGKNHGNKLPQIKGKPSVAMRSGNIGRPESSGPWV